MTVQFYYVHNQINHYVFTFAATVILMRIYFLRKWNLISFKSNNSSVRIVSHTAKLQITSNTQNYKTKQFLQNDSIVDVVKCCLMRSTIISRKISHSRNRFRSWVFGHCKHSVSRYKSCHRTFSLNKYIISWCTFMMYGIGIPHMNIFGDLIGVIYQFVKQIDLIK